MKVETVQINAWCSFDFANLLQRESPEEETSTEKSLSQIGLWASLGGHFLSQCYGRAQDSG